MDLINLTIKGALDLLAKGEITAKELTQNLCALNEKLTSLNIYITPTFEHALQMADASDKRRQKGQVGLLEGIPLGIKDLFCTKGFVTTAGSHILKNFIPTYESTVTDQLWKAGAVMMGKLNMDEFAMGSSNMTSYYGPVENPWKRKQDSHTKLVPGGSSGGSSAAVAASMALGATGTDTGGSIRQPAAFTGIVGAKPTYGRCSRWGIVAFASSLDQAGPMARTVYDAALMLKAMAGYDEKDSTSAKINVPDFTGVIGQSIKGLKIGIPEQYRTKGMANEIEQLWQQGIQWLEKAGAIVKPVSLPYTQYALPVYYIIAPAEASSNLARYDGVRYGLRVPAESLDAMYELTRAAGFGREVKRRIFIGTYVLSAGYYDAYYLKAQKVRNLIRQDFVNVFKEVDALLTPTTPTPAFGIGEKMVDPIAMYLNDIFTVPVNLAGLPALSIPAGLSNDGLPLGLQIISRSFDEEMMFRLGYVLEREANFNAKPDLSIYLKG
ncbi:MAG: Asp-tRNA(Asn)/Glu-tRNA(Gln) amidotransferase subunit GatA [Alphaproteobacteria bacterium]|nr:Asp-tRNA(Asn)/Glu-tRNA(Gln) amidotransferase subunit GatA [Alphaproteobacteria bacterium]